ncbi:MAG: hypothetical protein L0387_09890 [Acidobacteria bacterium]|nr:hypothetical protein [Acidobacteriota bacterium]MCI0721160.1 hypothetical protein [Acidobacteriota bacterium]
MNDGSVSTAQEIESPIAPSGLEEPEEHQTLSEHQFAKKICGSKDRFVLFLILGLTVLLYLGSLPKEFTNWDDQEYVVKNPFIRSFSLANLNRIVSEPYFANYAPVTLLSYALDYKLWKLNPTGYHFHNVVLHLACVWVLFSLLGRMGLPRIAVLIVVCLFAIHPVNVESVSWASERKNLLATLFFLLSLDQYSRYSHERSNLNYLLSLLCFLLSILAKASTIVAPLAFVAFDYCFSRKKLRDLSLYDKLPFIAFAEIHAFFSIHAAGVVGALTSYHKGGALLSLIACGQLFKDYLVLLFWPKNLDPLILPEAFPAFRQITLWLQFFLGGATLAILFRLSRKLFFWCSFFVIFLIPVLNVIPLPVMMAHRYLYIPQIGIWVIFGLSLHWLVQILKPFQLARVTTWGLLGCWLMFLAYQTFEHAKVYRNSYSLWSHAIEKNFFNALAHCNLGYWYDEKKMVGNSGREHFTALMIAPKFYYSLSGLATYYYEKGKLDLAIDTLYKGLNTKPDSKEILNNLGKVLVAKGQTRRGLFMFFRASYANPKSPEAFNNIVVWYIRANLPEAALEVAQTMVKNFPESSVGYFRVGQALEARGDLEGALKVWEESKRKPVIEEHVLKMIDEKMIAAQQKLAQKALPGS